MYAAGTLLAGRYRLEQRLGTGGMGDVWRSIDELLGRTVAVKIMLPNLTDDPGFTARFLREARIMASLTHPGVVAVHDVVHDGSAALLVMEFVEGEALSSILRRERRLVPARAMALIAEAADALHAAHAEGIVHRDIKPANLLVRPNGSVVIIDFGIAASEAATRLTGAGMLLGTAPWMSPEQAAGQVATPASDIYALGVVAYECVAGRRPFVGEHPSAILLKHLHDEPPTLPDDIPAAAVDMVARALAKNPGNRWQSAADFAAAARRVVPEPPPQTARKMVPKASEAAPAAAVVATRRSGAFQRPLQLAAAIAAVLGVTGATILIANQLARPGEGARVLTTVDPPAASAGTGPDRAASTSWADCDSDPNGCNTGDPVSGGRIVWAVNSTVEGWNVHGANSTTALHEIMSAVSPSTGGFLPDGTWQWNLDLLAEEPELTSNDPQTWVYRIRPEATWSDGTEITADDFTFVWKHNAGDDALCSDCNLGDEGYRPIDSVAGSDASRTVTVTLKPDTANAEWRHLFQNLYPSHLARHQGFDLDTPDGMKAASDWFDESLPAWSGGPWRIAEAAPTGTVTLEPNQKWYGGTAPSLDTIVVRAITNPQVLRSALTSGQIDGAGPIRPATWLGKDIVESIGSTDGVIDHMGFGDVWEHLDLNTVSPWLADVELRRAILTAVDVAALVEDTIAETAPGAVPRKNHLFPEDSPHFMDVIGPTGQGTGDADEALAILRAAGYTFDGSTLAKEGRPVGPLRLVHTERNRLRAAMAELVRSDLAEIGIEATIETTSSLGDTLRSRDFDLILYAWVGGPGFRGIAHQYWHSEGVGNYGAYENADVDRLVSEEPAQSDLDDAARLANEAAAIVASDAYVLPISDQPVYTFMSGGYLNVRPNYAAGVFYNTHEWGRAAPAGP